MNFRKAESYLLSLGNEVETMKLGLDNIRILLDAIGNPQTNYLKVQVAGTNGKGSVCAFLDSICREAGIATGLYTSPHLISITERIKINGRDIAEEQFAVLATQIREKSESLVAIGQLKRVPTYFEQVMAMALIAFADANVELAILETGLGGRYDAVTAANAEICAITRIDLDHQEYLGDSIEQIATEKAAIIRSDSTVVIAHQSKSVEQVILGRCRENGVDPHWASTAVEIKNESDIAPAVWGSIKTAKAFYGNLEFWNMLGKHQFQNAAIAIAVAEILQEDGFVISIDQISMGLETARHPGRLEYVRNFLLDGAHNVAGAKALREYLDEFNSKPIILIFGAMKGKEAGQIGEILFPMAQNIVLTEVDSSRAMTADEIAASTRAPLDSARYFLTENVADAVAKANEIAGTDSIILITGSLYLVGEVKKLLTQKSNSQI